MKKTNLLLINSNSDLNGSSISLLNHIKYLDRKDYNFCTILPVNGPLVGMLKNYCDVYVFNMLPITKSFTKLIKLVFNFMKTVLGIRKIIQQNNIDIVHVNTITNIYCGFACIGLKCKLVYHIREIPGFYPSLIWVLYKINLYLFADHLICCSSNVKKYLSIKSVPAIVIYNGVNIPNLKKSKKIQKAIIIGTFANESKRKGLKYLLNAIYELKKHYQLIRLHISINKPDEETIRGKEILNLIKSLKLEKYVVFTGLKKEISTYFKDISVFVTPSLYEAFPRSVIEAMSYSLPVIATDTGGTSEVLKTNVTGILVPPKNSNSISDAIKLILENNSLSVAMAENGRLSIENNFDAKDISFKIQKHYLKILQVSSI